MKEDYLKQIKKMFVNNGEYEFKDEVSAARFINKILSKAEDKYNYEYFYRDYEEFSDFLYTHHVDSIAYWIYQDSYEYEVN